MPVPTSAPVPVHVLLPAHAHHAAGLVLQAGAVPILDATDIVPDQVLPGAWVRIRPGHSVPGRGPVVLAEDGAPILDRPTWLESSAVRPVPPGFAGLILKGVESAGLGGEQSGLEMLMEHPDPERVLVDAGAGPTATAAISALGAAGVVVCGPLLALPELGLHPVLRRRLALPDDEVTHRIANWRVGNPLTAPVIGRLAEGDDPWTLATGVWQRADLMQQLWVVDQGAALGLRLAERFGTLGAALAAYTDAWTSWEWRPRQARAAKPARVVFSGAALEAAGTAAGAGDGVGLAVLWEHAAQLGRPVYGPVLPAVAAGLHVIADAAEVAHARETLIQQTPTLGGLTQGDMPDTPRQHNAQHLDAVVCVATAERPASPQGKLEIGPITALHQALADAGLPVIRGASEEGSLPLLLREDTGLFTHSPSSSEDLVYLMGQLRCGGPTLALSHPDTHDLDALSAALDHLNGGRCRRAIVWSFTPQRERCWILELHEEAVGRGVTPLATLRRFVNTTVGSADAVEHAVSSLEHAFDGIGWLARGTTEIAPRALVAADGHLGPLHQAVLDHLSETMPVTRSVDMSGVSVLSTLRDQDPRRIAHLALSDHGRLLCALWEASDHEPQGADVERTRWIQAVTGWRYCEVVHDKGRLWVSQAPVALAQATEPDPQDAPSEVRLEATSEPTQDEPLPEPAPDLLGRVCSFIAGRFGFGTVEIDPDDHLAEDLQMDLVAQAELFGAFLDYFGLPRGASYDALDDPSVRGVAAWIAHALETRSSSSSGANLRPKRGDHPDALVPEWDDEADPPTLSAPAGPGSPLPAALAVPPIFRVRRTVLVPAPPYGKGALRGQVVRVLGDSSLKAPLEERLAGIGVSIGEHADWIVDVGASKAEIDEIATRLDPTPPKRWITVTHTGLSSGATPQALAREGARIGGARALRRRWPSAHVQVVDRDAEADSSIDPLMTELDQRRLDPEIAWVGGRRYASTFAIEGPPTRRRWEHSDVVLVIGDFDGPLAAAAQECVRRGTTMLTILAPEAEPADPATVERLRSAGATVEYEQLNPPQFDQQLAQRLDRVGPISLCLADGSLPIPATSLWETLTGALPPETRLCFLGDLALLLGAAESLDASDTLQGLCLLAPTRSATSVLNLPTSKQRSNTQDLLELGVDELDQSAAAGLVVDLISDRADGVLQVFGRLGKLSVRPHHPWLQFCDRGGDETTCQPGLSVTHLSLSSAIELLAATAQISSPGLAFAGIRDVHVHHNPTEAHIAGQALEVVDNPAAEGSRHGVLYATRPAGSGHQQRVPIVEGTITLGVAPETPALPSAILPDEHVDANDLEALFKGQAGAVLHEVLGVAADAMLAEAFPSVSSGGLVSEPDVFEAALQAITAHYVLTTGSFPLWSSIDEVQLLGPPPDDHPMTLLIRARAARYDVDVTTPLGPLLRVRGLTTRPGPPATGTRLQRLADPTRPYIFSDGPPLSSATNGDGMGV